MKMLINTGPAANDNEALVWLVWQLWFYSSFKFNIFKTNKWIFLIFLKRNLRDNYHIRYHHFKDRENCYLSYRHNSSKISIKTVL